MEIIILTNNKQKNMQNAQHTQNFVNFFLIQS